MKLLLIGLLILGSFSIFADIIKDKDGDMYTVNLITGKKKRVYINHINEQYKPYTIISANLIKDKDGDMYAVNPKTGRLKLINTDAQYKPYTTK